MFCLLFFHVNLFDNLLRSTVSPFYRWRQSTGLQFHNGSTRKHETQLKHACIQNAFHLHSITMPSLSGINLHVNCSPGLFIFPKFDHSCSFKAGASHGLLRAHLVPMAIVNPNDRCESSPTVLKQLCHALSPSSLSSYFTDHTFTVSSIGCSLSP